MGACRPQAPGSVTACVQQNDKGQPFFLSVHTVLSSLACFFLSWSTLCGHESLADRPGVVAHTRNPNALEARVCQTAENQYGAPCVWLMPFILAQGHPWPSSEIQASLGPPEILSQTTNRRSTRVCRYPLSPCRVLSVGCTSGWGRGSLDRPRVVCLYDGTAGCGEHACQSHGLVLKF